MGKEFCDKINNRIYLLHHKRYRQHQLAEWIGISWGAVKEMTDEQVRIHNLQRDNYFDPHNLEIEGIRLCHIYTFARDHYDKTEENILNASLENLGMNDKTLLNSWSDIVGLTAYRVMNKKQWDCFEEAARTYKQYISEHPDYQLPKKYL